MAAKVYRVGRCATGLGLFATLPIAKGALIVEYSGRRISTRQAREREARIGCRFMFEINSRWTVDGSTRRNIGRYANHSCRPNAESVVVKGKLMLRAIKAIAAGEEITYDYGREYFELFIKPQGCRCAKCARTEVAAPRGGATRSATSASARSDGESRRSRAGSSRTSAPSGRSRQGAKGRRPG